MLDQVLNDLPIIRALQILCYGTQALKNSVFNHQQYRQLFLSPADTAPVLDLFRLYRDVCWFRRLPLANQWSHLSNIYRHVQRGWGSRNDALRKVETELKGIILRELQLSELDEAILSAQTSKPCPNLDQNNLTVLKERWNWIKQGKLVLNAAKAKQINEVADIVADYPGRLRLKKPLDPSQDGPRPNTQHIINGFRGAAGRVLKDRHVNHWYRVRCCKAVDCIEVIPYDKYLWLFLDTVKRYPPANAEHCMEEVYEISILNDVAVSSSLHPTPSVSKSPSIATPEQFGSVAPESLAPMKFEYPVDIAIAIAIVMKGLVNVYTGSELLLVPRIDWSPTSSSSDPPRPVFLFDTKPHSPKLPQHLHRCRGRKVMAYDEREYEWLRVFLKVVTWMEDNLSGKEEQDLVINAG